MWITFFHCPIALPADERNATQQQPNTSTGLCFKKFISIFFRNFQHLFGLIFGALKKIKTAGMKNLLRLVDLNFYEKVIVMKIYALDCMQIT